MKSKFVNLLIACLICLWLGSGLVADCYASDLEFSQVLTYGRNTIGTDTYTVPAGKVWHVTFMHAGYETTSKWGYIKVDGVHVCGVLSGGGAPYRATDSGLWLEAGTELELTIAGSASTYTNTFVSIIEYTVQ